MKTSILIRSYNSAKTIERAVESVLLQKTKSGKVEVVIADDGSGDNSVEVVKKFGSKILVLTLPHLGPIPTLNQGLRAVTGELVTILDADDVLPDGALGVYEKGDKADYWYGDYEEVSVGGKKRVVSTKKNIFDTIAGGIMFRKEALVSVGWYDETLIFPEYDVLMKLISRGYKGLHVKGEVYKYFRREGSVTSDKERVRRGIMQLERKWDRSLPIRKY